LQIAFIFLALARKPNQKSLSIFGWWLEIHSIILAATAV